MYARTVEEAESRLSELRHDELSTAALSISALLCSLLSTQLYPAAALPLFVGGAWVGVLGMRAMWRHWDLLDRIADEPDAYAIAEVHAYAARDATMARRTFYAEAIRGWTRHPPTLTAYPRISTSARDLEELASELEDATLELDVRCALACRRLLTDPTTSPLLNNVLPSEDVQSSIARIRRGFTPRAHG
jgi:hypothetical protein